MLAGVSGSIVKDDVIATGRESFLGVRIRDLIVAVGLALKSEILSGSGVFVIELELRARVSAGAFDVEAEASAISEGVSAVFHLTGETSGDVPLLSGVAGVFVSADMRTSTSVSFRKTESVAVTSGTKNVTTIDESDGPLLSASAIVGVELDFGASFRIGTGEIDGEPVIGGEAIVTVFEADDVEEARGGSAIAQNLHI